MSDQTKDQIPNPLGDFPRRWRVSDLGASLPVQREYIDYHRNVDPERCMQANVAEVGKPLFDPAASIEEKQSTLATLAHNGTLEAYRMLEAYAEQADEELTDWAALALHECQAFLEASLGDAAVGMVMGGLGGEGDRTRFFLAVKSETAGEFAGDEQAAVETVFRRVGKHLDTEIERFEYGQNYVAMEVLIPLDTAVAKFVEQGIRATNRVDTLLDREYYVRNDRVPTKQELLHWIQEIKDNV